MGKFQITVVNNVTYVVNATVEEAELILRLKSDEPVRLTKLSDGKIIIIRAGKISSFEEIR